MIVFKLICFKIKRISWVELDFIFTSWRSYLINMVFDLLLFMLIICLNIANCDITLIHLEKWSFIFFFFDKSWSSMEIVRSFSWLMRIIISLAYFSNYLHFSYSQILYLEFLNFSINILLYHFVSISNFVRSFLGMDKVRLLSVRIYHLLPFLLIEILLIALVISRWKH